MRNEASGWKCGIGVRAARGARRAVAVIGGVLAMAAGLAAPAAASPSSLLPIACSLLPALTIAHSPLPSDGFNWAIIGDPGNAPYDGRFFDPEIGENTQNRGRVDYVYRITRTEVTSEQWLPFVNQFAQQAEVPFSFGRPSHSGLEPLGGPPGRYRLDPDIPNAGRVAVEGITWFESAMFCNWLHNGKPTDIADVMHGAYDLLDDEGELILDAHRAPGATYFIPTLDEWMKAAHWDPQRFGEDDGGWWKYPHQSDDPPITGLPGVGETSAGLSLPNSEEWEIPTGSYVDVQSPWGLWDVSGSASEWLEEFIPFGQVGLRGRKGSEVTSSIPAILDLVGVFSESFPVARAEGLRIASAIPCPSAAGLALTCFAFLHPRKRGTT